MMSRPSNVVRFEQLMYVSLGIQEIVFLWDWYADGLGSDAGIALVGQALNLAFFGLFIWLAARRRKNWARRVLVLVWVLAGRGYIRRLLPYYLAHGPDALAFGFATTISIQLVALIFIFTGNSREWFGPSPSLKDILGAVGIRYQSN
jgi:hypothetical protein